MRLSNIFKSSFFICFLIIFPSIYLIYNPGKIAAVSLICNAVLACFFYSLHSKGQYNIVYEDNIQKYWIWLITINIIRAFVFDSNAEDGLRDCLMSSFSIMMPLMMFYVNTNTLKSLFICRGILSLIAAYQAYIVSLSLRMYGFIDVPHLLMPFGLYALFTPFLKWKWRIVIFGICLYSLLFDVSVRANVFLISFCLFTTVFITYFPKITEKCLKPLWIVLLSTPLILSTLGYLGIYNPFVALESEDLVISLDGSKKRGSYSIDSRTGVYLEYLASADNLKTILIGDGPISRFSTSSGGIASDFAEYSRREVEAGILNILKRYGFLGGVVFFLLIYRGSKKALYDSNNTASKLLAIYISFKFLYIFIEESAISIDTYMAIGLCYNSEFRRQTDSEIKNVFNNKCA